MDVGSVGGTGEVNADVSGVEGEPDEEYIQFAQKDDWTQASLDTMQKLTAEATAEQMQDGNGVILSKSDILNGTVGIENDSNYQILNKFLKVYPELDGVDITGAIMNEIEDKLSKDDGQFDAFLQQNLSDITGTDQVDSTLQNEMFSDFTAMGGEKEPEPEVAVPAFGGSEDGIGDFGDFLSNDFSEMNSIGATDEDDVEKVAKDTVTPVSDLDFPNLS